MALPTTGAEIRNKPVQPGIDPNVKIPKQILDAGKRSEAIQQAITGEAEPSVEKQLQEGQAEPTPQPNGETPPQPNGEATPADNQPVDWERQFKSLSGRLDAQRTQINDMSQRLEAAQRENAMLRSAPEARQEQQPPAGLSEQEIADYGPELVDVMRRVAREAAAPLEAEIYNLRGQLGHVQQETGTAFLNRMNQTLDGAVPGWAALNKDPRFIEWAQLPDIFSGAIRKTLMQDAWNSGDANRVIAFFRAYLAEEAAVAPQGTGGQRTPPPSRMVVSDQPVDPRLSPPTPGAPLDLATLAAPGRAHSAGSQPAEKPVYTAAEITRFYTDVAAGRWRGREQQQQAIDQDIMLAQREGRIIPDNRSQLPKDPYMR